MPRKKSYFIPSAGKQVYVELGFPKKVPAPAVIVAHGLRSYYPGFLDMFAKAFREAGYISVKFHYLGTGKSSGKFEGKSTKAMLQNYNDVLRFLEKIPQVKGIGVMARSNSGSLATIHGPDKAVKAYIFLAAPAYYSKCMGHYLDDVRIAGKFFYHKSFKRAHTKGAGRLPLSFIAEVKRYDKVLLRNASKMKPVIFFQSTGDEAVQVTEGHYDFWKKNLPNPKKIVLIEGGNHSYKGHKRFVINQGIKWLKKYLPIG